MQSQQFHSLTLPIAAGSTPADVGACLDVIETAYRDGSALLEGIRTRAVAELQRLPSEALVGAAQRNTVRRLRDGLMSPAQTGEPSLSLEYWAMADEFCLALLPLGQVLSDWAAISQRVATLKASYDTLLEDLDTLLEQCVHAECAQRQLASR